MVKPRKVTYDSLSAEALTDELTHNGDEIDCMQESRFLLGYDITETGAIANGDIIQIVVQFRRAGGTWRDFTRGPFHALFEEESTTPCNHAIDGACEGEKMRVNAVATYAGSGDPGNIYFTVTAEVTLMTPT